MPISRGNYYTPQSSLVSKWCSALNKKDHAHKKKQNSIITHNQETSKSIESDIEMAQMMKTSAKDFKIIMINMCVVEGVASIHEHRDLFNTAIKSTPSASASATAGPRVALLVFRHAKAQCFWPIAPVKARHILQDENALPSAVLMSLLHSDVPDIQTMPVSFTHDLTGEWNVSSRKKKRECQQQQSSHFFKDRRQSQITEGRMIPRKVLDAAKKSNQ